MSQLLLSQQRQLSDFLAGGAELAYTASRSRASVQYYLAIFDGSEG
jgi:hypothetical protein